MNNKNIYCNRNHSTQIEDVIAKNPLFSIIIPTYNRAALLDRCLMSLCDQTYKNFEVLVCDDGSTDNSKEITEKYINALNIQYLWEPNWGGPARPRNRGIAVAKGEWICFLDSDDWWKPEKLQLCLPYLNVYELIYHDLEIVGKKPNVGKVFKSRVLKGDFFRDILVGGNSIPNSSVVLRKEIIKKVGFQSEDPKMISVEDSDYLLRVAQITNKFRYIPRVLGCYWVGDNNISHSINHIFPLETLYNKYIPQLLRIDQYLARNFLYFVKAYIYHKNGNFIQAKTNYLSSMSFRNSLTLTIKSIVGFLLCLMHYRI